MQIGPKKKPAWGCARIAFLTLYCFSRFLDVDNASSMPHLIRNLIIMTLLFLAVQDSSIGDLVSHSLTHSLISLLILVSSEHCQSTAELL